MTIHHRAVVTRVHKQPLIHRLYTKSTRFGLGDVEHSGNLPDSESTLKEFGCLLKQRRA
jgi:hypothetical protein